MTTFIEEAFIGSCICHFEKYPYARTRREANSFCVSIVYCVHTIARSLGYTLLNLSHTLIKGTKLAFGIIK